MRRDTPAAYSAGLYEMTSSSTGSNAFTIVSFLTICLAVLLVLRYYLPLRSAPAFLTIPIFLALALPASAILLVPIDLASSARTEDEVSKGIWLPERAVLVSWRITYWLTFILTWAVLPLLGEYMDAGYRDPQARWIYSLRSNGRYQLIMLGCATLGLIYMIFSYGFDITAIKGLVMALAYVWGLVLAIYLMGHGLVAIPRRMFRRANLAGSLQRVQARAPVVHEKLEDAIINLEEIEGQIKLLKQRKSGTARDFQDWIDDLADTIGQLPTRPTLATPDPNPGSKVPAVITERYLADVTRRLARARHQRARYVEEWDLIVQTASDLQTILDSKASRKLTFGQSRSSSFLTRYSPVTPYIRYLVYVHVLPAFRLCLGAVLSLAGAAIIYSEIIRFPAPQFSAVSITVIHHPSQDDYQIGFGGQLVAAGWICYMCICALTSITDVPTWNQRALVRRNTYPESACWYAGQIARLTVPLAYNFLTFLPRNIHQKTTFYTFLGRLVNLTPLGTWFDYLFPMFILIPVCATLFNLYGKFKRIFGIDFMEEDDEEDNPSGFGTGGWREGRDLIARDLNGPARSTNTLGLNSSPRASLDTRRAGPTLWVPPAQRSSDPSPSRSGAQRSAYNRQAPPLDPEPEDENFFALFGRRVKNTIDQIDTPKWMQNDSRGEGGPGLFKKPKWMNNEGSGDTNFIDRLFNGNASSSSNPRSDGRIVL